MNFPYISKEHGLRVFQNGVLRRIFGPKREDLTGGWRKLHNKVHNLYSSPNSIRVKKSSMRWVGHMKKKYKIWFEYLKKKATCKT
jgi:hypothetical protein